MNLDADTIDALGYGGGFDPWRFAVLDVDLRAADAVRKREERAERTATDRKAVNAYNRAARARRRSGMTDEQRRVETAKAVERMRQSRARKRAARAARRAS